MKIILSHETTFEYWRAAPTGTVPSPSPTRIATPPKRVPAHDEIAAALSSCGFNPNAPVHVLVAPEAKRASSAMVQPHSFCGDLPKGALLRLDDRLLVTSAEFCLLQIATDMSLPDLIRSGCELCSTYAVHAQAQKIEYGCEPATSLDKLQAFTDKSAGLQGIKPLRRALRYILPNSASPMETALALLLALPCSLGGYGLPAPQLNRRVDVETYSEDLTSQDFYKCDLFWEDAKVAVEYDSTQYHTAADKIAHDARRRNELSALGISVLTVTAKQLLNWPALDKTAHVLAKHLGKRIQPQCKDYLQRQFNLRKALLQELEEDPCRRKAQPRISDVISSPSQEQSLENTV